MRLSRRHLLLAAPLLMAAAPRPVPPHGTVRLRPQGPAVAYRVGVEPAASRLTFAGFRQIFTLPGEATPLGTYPIAGREVLAIGFDASALAGVTQKLVALIGWDGKTLRLLDVETLEFASSDNGSQSSLAAHLAPSPDHRALQLIVEASRAEHGKPAHRENWTDLLAWHDGAPLAPGGTSKAAAGTWQARMDASRTRIAALLTPPRTVLTLDMLAPTGLLDPLGAAPR